MTPDVLIVFSSGFQCLNDSSNTLSEMGQIVLDLTARRLPELSLSQSNDDEMTVVDQPTFNSVVRTRTHGVSCQRASVVFGSKRVAWNAQGSSGSSSSHHVESSPFSVVA